MGNKVLMKTFYLLSVGFIPVQSHYLFKDFVTIFRNCQIDSKWSEIWKWRFCLTDSLIQKSDLFKLVVIPKIEEVMTQIVDRDEKLRSPYPYKFSVSRVVFIVNME